MDATFRRANVLSLSRHVPSLSGSATRRVAPNEARKRRANERHVVGCCEELAGPKLPDWIFPELVVYCCENQVVMDRLANQHSIERIAVERRQLQNLRHGSGFECET